MSHARRVRQALAVSLFLVQLGPLASGLAAEVLVPTAVKPLPGWLCCTYAAVAGGNVFFALSDSVWMGQGRTQLWKSDGTAAGTVAVKDIAFSGGYIYGPFDSMVGSNGTLFIAASGDLWRSDGTPAGTVLVVPFRASLGWLTAMNGKVFFTVSGGSYPPGLWASDGTPAGTVLLTSAGGMRLTAVNGTLFFWGAGGLWKSDGTHGGTVPVKSFPPTFSPYLMNGSGTLYFFVDDYATGTGLWKSDGTATGTVLVKQISSKTGTVRVKPISANGVVADQPRFASRNGTLFFVADDGVHGYELWTSDGTPEGTRMVKDIVPGSVSTYFTDIAVAGGTVFFVANDGIHGAELWKTDGTEAGTVLVKDIAPGPNMGLPQGLTEALGTLFFTATDIGDVGAVRDGVWRSDGTEAGTVRLTNSYSHSSSILGLRNVGTMLLYTVPADVPWSLLGGKLGIEAIVPRAIQVAPPTGAYASSQRFDLAVTVDTGGRAIAGVQVVFDGVDVSAGPGSCLAGPGTTIAGTGTGVALACPGLSGGVLGAGAHTVAVTVHLAGGESRSDTVTWIALDTVER